MAAPMNDLPPEVLALLDTTRALTSQAFRLSRSINETVNELHEFTDDLRKGLPRERRVADRTYEGEDRRV